MSMYDDSFREGWTMDEEEPDALEDTLECDTDHDPSTYTLPPEMPILPPYERCIGKPMYFKRWHIDTSEQQS